MDLSKKTADKDRENSIEKNAFESLLPCKGMRSQTHGAAPLIRKFHSRKLRIEMMMMMTMQAKLIPIRT